MRRVTITERDEQPELIHSPEETLIVLLLRQVPDNRVFKLETIHQRFPGLDG